MSVARHFSRFFLVYICLCSGSVAAADDVSDVRYVEASVARLRKTPSKSAKVGTTLRIGTPVKLIEKSKSGFSKVETLDEQQYFVKTNLLTKSKPVLKDILADIDAAKTLKEKRHFLLRACAMAPSDEKIIEDYAAVLKKMGNKRLHHWAIKGLIAAERRELSWDGPLYPLVNNLAYTSLPCPKNLRKSGSRKTLRGRAFPLVASGKVVSISKQRNRTQHLGRPLCLDDRLAFEMPVKVSDGILVPSWTVAGSEVSSLREIDGPEGTRLFASPDSLVELALSDGLHIQTIGFETSQNIASREERRFGPFRLPGGEAEPVAFFTDDGVTFVFAFIAEREDAKCGTTHNAWLVRLNIETKEFTQGRVYTTSEKEACRTKPFAGLEGEPRCERLPEGCELGKPRLKYPSSISPTAEPSSP